MGVIGRFLLECCLVPFLLTSCLLAVARVLRWPPASSLASALAVPAAIGATYWLAFGWPPGLVMDARTKTLMAAIAGAIIGLGLAFGARWAKVALLVLAIGVPIWVGLPALRQARPSAVLLILPVVLGSFLAVTTSRNAAPFTKRRTLILMTFAVGLAPIAVFARALSYSELCLAAASALLAVLVFGPERLQPPPLTAAAATLLALTTSLLLYSEASVPAVAVLSSVLLAETVDARASRHLSKTTGRLMFPLLCFLPMALAALIARIDAGAFSLY